MFRPVGSFIPTAVVAEIGLFFNNDQLHKFSLTSPTANGLFESNRMMTYTKIRICAPEKNNISIELEDSNIDDTKRKIQIDADNEDVTEKISILLSTCHSIDRFNWVGDRCTKWNYFNEKLMELMLNIKIKKMILSDCSISVSLPLFLNFLHRHGSILTLNNVKLPSELVSNKTLSLISKFDVLPMPGSDLVVDVSDEFLEGYNTSFHISDFLTNFTIKGISAFIQKHVLFCKDVFGTLASDQLEDALVLEREHTHISNKMQLKSKNGQKRLNIYGQFNFGRHSNNVGFSINLNRDTDQSGMVPIPNNLFGIVSQESFLKFNKIFFNPGESLPISQYQMDNLRFNSHDGFNIEYTVRDENRKIIIKRTDVNLKDTHTIIVEILRNCTSINRLYIPGIKLDEDFYHLLKPIADNIHVPEWRIKSTLEPESLREVQEANSGLFANINLTF